MERRSKAPWHLAVVGVVALLWNAAGAYTIVMAQLGRLPDIPPDEVAYYAAQPVWLVIVTDVALFGAIAAAVALLLRNPLAVWLFAISLAAILLTHSWDFLMGTSRAFANAGALIVTLLILLFAVFEVWYAREMRRKGLLS